MKVNFYLLLYVLTPIIAAVVMNAIIYAKKWNGTTERSPLLPPGWVIGLIWMILFGTLGYVAYIHRTNAVASIAIATLFVYCLLYPVYTNKFKDPYSSKLANLLTLILAFVTTLIIALFGERHTVGYILPLITWASYVNIIDAVK